MKSNYTKWTFLIALWDDTGNTLLERYKKTVTRKEFNSAQNYVKNKFPRPYFVELESATHSV